MFIINIVRVKNDFATTITTKRQLPLLVLWGKWGGGKTTDLEIMKASGTNYSAVTRNKNKNILKSIII